MKYLTLIVVWLALLPAVCAAEKKNDKSGPPQKEAADPLAKFGDENLAKIDFCFDKFCEAVAAKDARVAAAFLAEMPKNLAALNLATDAGKTAFLQVLSGFAGAQCVSSLKLAMGIGEVKYRDKQGQEKSQRMQNSGGRWKLAGL